MEQADRVRHYMVILPNEFSKIKVTLNKILWQADAAEQVIIYVSTKEIGYLLYKSIIGAGCEAASIHADVTQRDRQKILDSFNRKHTQFLITTDVYARGFDHSEVNLVINHFLPLKRDSSSEDPEIDTNVYLQRFYSCPNGAVFNLLCGDTDDKIIRKINRVLNGQGVTRLPFWRSTEDYEVALREAVDSGYWRGCKLCSFVPAILVTPLGALSILISEVLAQIILREKLHIFGVLGCALCYALSVLQQSFYMLPKNTQLNRWQKYGILLQRQVLVAVFILVVCYIPLYGQAHVMCYIGVCSVVGSLSVMSVKGLGIALKLTFSGMNQACYPQT